jgi:hypothetical protein
MRDVVAPRNIRLHLARSKALKRFLMLIGIQFRRTAKPHATGLSTLPALISTGSGPSAGTPMV